MVIYTLFVDERYFIALRLKILLWLREEFSDNKLKESKLLYDGESRV